MGETTSTTLRRLWGDLLKVRLSLVFTVRQRANQGEEAKPVGEKKNKKNKKKKSQDQLKKTKEMKLEMAQAQADSGVPSFAEFVTDSTEVVEEDNNLKRKSLANENKHKKK